MRAVGIVYKVSPHLYWSLTFSCQLRSKGGERLHKLSKVHTLHKNKRICLAEAVVTLVCTKGNLVSTA